MQYFFLIKMPAPVRAPKKTMLIANDAIFASDEVQTAAPVSYTHLTLPTKA